MADINKDVGRELSLGERDGISITGVFLGEWRGREWFWSVPDNDIMWRVPEIRECISAPEGYRILAADYSQIEVKLMAFLSQDPGLLKALNSKDSSGQNTDIHCYMATEVYGQKLGFDYELIAKIINGKSSEGWGKAHPRYKELKTIRSNIKTTTFGVPYGAGAQTIARQTGLSEEQAQQLIDDYFAKFPILKKWIDAQGDMAISYGFTQTPWGRKRFYVIPPRTNENYDAEMKQIRRWAGNHPIQSCLVGSTRVFQKQKGVCCLGDLAGQTVSLWDGTQFSVGKVKAAGLKRLYKITLENGQVFECSPEHKFLIATTRNTHRWVTAETLLQASKTGDSKSNWRLVLTDKVPLWRNKTILPKAIKPSCPNGKLISLSSITNKVLLGEILGRLASDGGYSLSNGSVYWIVAEHEKFILPRIVESVKNFGHINIYTHIKYTQSQPVYRINVCSMSLAKQLDCMDIKTRIPNIAWRDRMILASYLRGLFDGDGTVNKDNAVMTWGKGDFHLKWAEEVQTALLLFGIRSRVRSYPGKHGSVRLAIQKYDMPIFAKEIGFINPIKQAKANLVHGDKIKGVAKYGRAVSLYSVEDTKTEVEMFDFVNSETGRFMANGVIVHNSNADMLKYALRGIYSRIRGGVLNGKKLYDARLILVVHDEIVMMCSENDTETVKTIMQEAMTEAYDLIITGIPNKIDVVDGQTWEKV